MFDMFNFLQTGYHTVCGKEDGQLIVLEKDVMVNYMALDFY